MRLLLAKGAKANAVAAMPTLFPARSPKSGPIASAEVTPLLAAAAAAPVELIKALLDAGANVNARDGRGMTPLMLAVATNHQNPAVIRLLLGARRRRSRAEQASARRPPTGRASWRSRPASSC